MMHLYENIVHELFVKANALFVILIDCQHSYFYDNMKKQLRYIIKSAKDTSLIEFVLIVLMIILLFVFSLLI
jgi:hypothetical protein